MEESSIVSRVHARAAEKALKRAEEEANEMRWGPGALLAIKDPDCRFVIVKVLEAVDSSTVNSNTSFKGQLHSCNKFGTYKITKNVIDVKPADVLRPVVFNSEMMLPQKTVEWLQVHRPLEMLVDESDDDDDKDDDDEPPEDNGEEDEEEGDKEGEDADEDDERPAKKAKKPAKKPAAKKAAPKGKRAAPKKATREEREGKKKPAAKSSSKKAKKTHFPEAKSEELFGSSDNLDPDSHKEAMRAALTDNAVLLEKVIQSPAHYVWMSYSLTAYSIGAPKHEKSPFSIIVNRRNPKMFEVIAKHASKFGINEDVEHVPVQREASNVAKEVDLPSIFVMKGNEHAQYLMHNHPETYATWGAGVATPNRSLLVSYNTGMCSHRSYGRRVRQVRAGRGGRELVNAFTTPLNSMSSFIEEVVMQLQEIPVAEFDALIKAFTPGCQSFIRKMMVNHRQATTLIQQGAYKEAADNIEPLLTNEGFTVGKLHHTALIGNSIPDGTLRASIVKKGFNGATPLHYACVNPDPTILKKMLASDATLSDTTDQSAQTILHYAMMNRTDVAIKAIFELYPAIHLSPQAMGKLTPARLAVELKRPQNLKVLLTRDPQQQIVNRLTDKNLFLEAVMSGSVECAKVVFDAAPTDLKKKLVRLGVASVGTAPLHLAAQNGDVDMVKYLLSIKCPIDGKDRMKRTPLLLAAKSGHLDVLSLLANNGADVGAADSSGNQASHYACAYGHLDVLRYVLQTCGANPNAETSWKMTPLSLALLKGYSSTCGKWLLSNFKGSVDINFRDTNYRTVLVQILESASAERYPELLEQIKFVLSHGADPTLGMADGRTLLHVLATSTVSQRRRQNLQGYQSSLQSKIDFMKQRASHVTVSAADVLQKVMAATAQQALPVEEAEISPEDEESPEDEVEDAMDDGDEEETQFHPNAFNDDGDEDEDEDEDEQPRRKMPVMKFPRKAAKKAMPGAWGSQGGKGFGGAVGGKGFGGGFGAPAQAFAFGGQGGFGQPAQQRWQGSYSLNYSLTLDNLTMKSVQDELQRVNQELSMPDFGIEVCGLIFAGLDNVSAFVNTADTKGTTPLLAAAKYGNFLMVGHLLSSGASTQLSDENGFTILHLICASRNFSEMTLIPEAAVKGMSRVVDNGGMLPLHRAVESLNSIPPHQHDAKQLIDVVVENLKKMFAGDAGLLKSQVDKVRTNAMERTNQNPQMPHMPVQFNENFQVNRVFNGQEEFPSPDLTKIPPLPLLKQFEYFWYGGASILHLATATGQGSSHNHMISAILNILDPSGSLLPLKDWRGRTALHWAVLRSDPTAVQLIVDFAKSKNIPVVDVADDNGVTPLMIATTIATQNVNLTILRKLLESKPNVNAADNLGRTALHRAAASQCGQRIALLLGAGADVKAVSKDGRSVLHYSLACVQANVFHTFENEKKLLAAGADVNVVDAMNRSVLHYCFTDLNSTNVRMDADPIEAIGSLLARIDKAKLVNLKDSFGNTPVIYAVRSRSLSCTLSLANDGKCDMATTDEDGNSPLAVAMLNGNKDFAITLLQRKDEVKADTNIHILTSSHPKKEYRLEPTFLFSLNKAWHGLTYVLLQSGFPVREAVAIAINTNNIPLCESIVDKIPVAERKTRLGGLCKNGKTLLHILLETHHRSFSETLYRVFVDEVGLTLATKDTSGRCPHHYLVFHSIPVLQRMISLLSADKCDWKATHDGNKSVLSNLFPASPQGLGQEKVRGLNMLLAAGASSDFDVTMTVDVPQVDDENPGKRVTREKDTSALIWCLYANDVETLTALLQAKCPMDRTDSEKLTPLMHAVLLKNSAIVTVFLSHPTLAQVNAVDKDGYTALHHAVLLNNAEIVEKLCACKDVDINVQDKNGCAPLHVAVQPFEYGSFENVTIIRTLLSSPSINNSIRNLHGYTPVELTTMQASGTLKAVFESFGIVAPALSRISSIIPTTQWSQSHKEIDFESNAKAYMQAKMSSKKEQVVDPKNLVDPQYHRSNNQTTVGVVAVHNGFDCILTKVDVAYGLYGMNLFYRMQVLVDTLRNVGVLWTRWGRVGECGQFQATPFATASEAEAEFKSIFKSKTSNDWSCRGDFVKMPKKYLYHEPNTSTVKAEELLVPFTKQQLETPPTKLPKELFKIMNELVDVTRMNQEYKMTNVLTEAYPLGSLSPKAITDAFALLAQMRIELLKQCKDRVEDQQRREKVAELANAFYELVPRADHDRTSIAAPRDDNEVATLWHSLTTMQQLEISSRFLLSAHHCLKTDNPIDHVFNALNVDAAVVRADKDFAELSTIKRYIANSTSERVHAVFRIQRKGEGERFQKFCSGISRRLLLFHGSGSSNMLSILSSGLRIAPPEAPVAGYMFGKGIYFADMAAKSLGYCRRTNAEDSIFMFLCEVAVGRSYEPAEPAMFTTAPKDFESVKGVGGSYPDPTGDVVLSNGVTVPLGKVIQSDNRTRKIVVCHNEYIVYNVDQVRLRYLIQFKQADPKP